MKRFARMFAPFLAALVALGVFGGSAMAATPAPGYEQFAGCPSPAEDPAVTACLRSTISGGHFQMGSKDVPITNPITLSGGLDPNTEIVSANAKGGLTPVKQPVPGGIIGLTGLDWLVNFLNIEQLKLYAVTELAGAPKSSIQSFTLPIKVHLINPVLGNNCYVGSTANPIALDLTTGTTDPPAPNEPITGVAPEFNFDEATEILTFKDGTFVDNSFSAPGASGCTLTLLGIIPFSLNSLVNSQSGLPSAAGKNETTQDFDLELAPSELAYP